MQAALIGKMDKPGMQFSVMILYFMTLSTLVSNITVGILHLLSMRSCVNVVKLPLDKTDSTTLKQMTWLTPNQLSFLSNISKLYKIKLEIKCIGKIELIDAGFAEAAPTHTTDLLTEGPTYDSAPLKMFLTTDGQK